MTRTTEPRQITQGERIAWTRTVDGYSSAEFTLEYRFRGQGYGFNVDAAASGTDFAAEIASADSEKLKVTTYGWQAWLTEVADSTNTFCVDDGEIVVKQGFIAGSAAQVDLRSPNKIVLDMLTAAIGDKATTDQLEYEVTTPTGTVRIKRMSMKEMMDARTYYAKLVASEKARERTRKGGSLIQQAIIRMYDEN